MGPVQPEPGSLNFTQGKKSIDRIHVNAYYLNYNAFEGGEFFLNSPALPIVYCPQAKIHILI
jgi:hypothetical protein